MSNDKKPWRSDELNDIVADNIYHDWLESKVCTCTDANNDPNCPRDSGINKLAHDYCVKYIDENVGLQYAEAQLQELLLEARSFEVSEAQKAYLNNNINGYLKNRRAKLKSAQNAQPDTDARIDDAFELAALGYDHKDHDDSCALKENYTNAHQTIKDLIAEQVAAATLIKPGEVIPYTTIKGKNYIELEWLTSRLKESKQPKGKRVSP